MKRNIKDATLDCRVLNVLKYINIGSNGRGTTIYSSSVEYYNKDLLNITDYGVVFNCVVSAQYIDAPNINSTNMTQNNVIEHTGGVKSTFRVGDLLVAVRKGGRHNGKEEYKGDRCGSFSKSFNKSSRIWWEAMANFAKWILLGFRRRHGVFKGDAQRFQLLRIFRTSNEVGRRGGLFRYNFRFRLQQDFDCKSLPRLGSYELIGGKEVAA